jgi:opacity protein-like surface antigen
MNEQTTGTGIVNGPITYGSTRNLQAAGGFQAGYNWQFSPQWVAGIEGDFSFASINNNGPSTVIPGAPGNFVAMNESVQWLATARGKFGYVLGSTLWYVTGGAAWERANYSGARHSRVVQQSQTPALLARIPAGSRAAASSIWLRSTC